MRNVHSLKAFAHTFGVQPLDFTVEPVAHLFEHDVGVGIFPGVLSGRRYPLENLINVSHVEISAHQQVLGPPVVSSQKRMDILQSAFPCRGIAQVAHVDFSGKGEACFCILRIMELLRGEIFETGLYR